MDEERRAPEVGSHKAQERQPQADASCGARPRRRRAGAFRASGAHLAEAQRRAHHEPGAAARADVLHPGGVEHCVECRRNAEVAVVRACEGHDADERRRSNEDSPAGGLGDGGCRHTLGQGGRI